MPNSQPPSPPPAALPGTWPQVGTIAEFDPNDDLGWISLDGGARIRFGGSALEGFHGEAPVGMRVKVLGVVPGYKGVPKATKVQPLVEVAPPGHQATPAPELPTVSWDELVRTHPRWSDMGEVAVVCATPAPRPDLPEHPLFAPWRREIIETAPTCIDLHVPDYKHWEPIDPGPEDSFALGEVAWLDEPRWPICGGCGAPLEMCIQIAPAVLAPFVSSGRGLVALLCFECSMGDSADPRFAYLRLVEPKHRVTAPERAKTAAGRPLTKQSQRVTPHPPAVTLPGSNWYLHRRERGIDGAAAVLMACGGIEISDPLPPGVTRDDLDLAEGVYDDWLAEGRGIAHWRGARLGGGPSWTQYDRTPRCGHGEMLHLLEYEGGQFLDGVLHVFLCREGRCPLGFVAEF